MSMIENKMQKKFQNIWSFQQHLYKTKTTHVSKIKNVNFKLYFFVFRFENDQFMIFDFKEKNIFEYKIKSNYIRFNRRIFSFFEKKTNFLKFISRWHFLIVQSNVIQFQWYCIFRDEISPFNFIIITFTTNLFFFENFCRILSFI